MSLYPRNKLYKNTEIYETINSIQQNPNKINEHYSTAPMDTTRFSTTEIEGMVNIFIETFPLKKNSGCINPQEGLEHTNLIIITGNNLVGDIYYTPYLDSIRIRIGSRIKNKIVLEANLPNEETCSEELFQMSTVHAYADVVSFFMDLRKMNAPAFRLHFDDISIDKMKDVYELK